MGYSRSAQRDSTPRAAEATLAQALAPEDIRPGDFVVPLHEVAELPSFYWCGDPAVFPREALVRIRYTPESEPLPLKVRSVCLPFVLVKLPSGKWRTLDVRRCCLARLDRRHGALAWKAYKQQGRK